MCRARYSLSPVSPLTRSYSFFCGVVADRVGPDVVLQKGVDQDRLALKLDLDGDLGVLVEALLRGFLGDDFPVDELVAETAAQLGGIGLPLGGGILDREFEARLRDRDSVDPRHVACLPVRAGCECKAGQSRQRDVSHYSELHLATLSV